MNKDLNNYIKVANHSNEKWMTNNLPDIYNEIIEYNKLFDVENKLDFKQKLWHYQNNINYYMQCNNIECNNSVNFKRSWTQGYSLYCCQKCSIPDVENKKALLNYSRKSKLSEDDKLQKELKSIQRKQKNEESKNKKQNKIDYFNNISIDEYKNLSTIKNGIYTRESYVLQHMSHIHKTILDYTKHINDINFIERVYMYFNNINKKSICKYSDCNNNLQFINSTIGYHEYCSNSCSSKDNYDIAKNTFKEKYGVSHHSQLQHNIDKTINNIVTKFKNNIVDTGEFIEYNHDTKLLKAKCNKCNNIHEIPLQIMKQRYQLDLDWRNCITGYMNGTSNQEKEIVNYIKNIYSDEIILNSRKILNGKEIDIYLPKLKLGIEFNGLYWHSEVNKENTYHNDKYNITQSLGIQLIQIYEDEWKYKKDIIKSRLKNLISKDNNKVFARKCIISEIPFKQAKEFLNNNHLQGSINSSINIGLFYNTELLSVMTLGKPRKGIKYKNIDNKNNYELYRYCTKIGYNIIGGASKLFSHIINNYLDIDEIYSFSNLEWPGTIYEKIGMKFKSLSKDSYWFIDRDRRISRHNYTKQQLIKMGYDKNKSANQILKELKIYKIFGAGTKTYIWNRY